MSDGVLKELGRAGNETLPRLGFYLQQGSPQAKPHDTHLHCAGGFLVAVMFGLADMYLKSMTDETRHQTGDWHCKITAIDEKTSEYIAARPEIDLSGWQGNIPQKSAAQWQISPFLLQGWTRQYFLKFI